MSPPELPLSAAQDQTRPGRMLLSCGTAWVILAVPENCRRYEEAYTAYREALGLWWRGT